jgi:hypothetical protein
MNIKKGALAPFFIVVVVVSGTNSKLEFQYRR